MSETRPTDHERRRGASWVRLAQGVHRPAAAKDVRRAELAAWAERLPSGAVFTGLTAAQAWGLWLPPLPDGLPVFVAVPSTATASQRSGVVVCRQAVRSSTSTTEESAWRRCPRCCSPVPGSSV